MSQGQDKGLVVSNFDKRYIKTKNRPNYIEKVVYQRVIKSVTEWIDEMFLHTNKVADVKFVFCDDWQLVFHVDYGEKQYSLVMAQPDVPLGEMKTASDNLTKYAKVRKESVLVPLQFYNVISPYYDEKKEIGHTFWKEMYFLPSLEFANCIISQKEGFGMFVPEIYSAFEAFSEEESEVVCACMIAKLVSLYDDKTQSGIAACRLGGGDFVLDKAWDRNALSTENTLKCMRLVAARKEVKCSYEEYLSLIRHEFGQKTFAKSEMEKDKSILLNHQAKCGVTSSAIEQGIKLGEELRLKNSAKKEIGGKCKY